MNDPASAIAGSLRREGARPGAARRPVLGGSFLDGATGRLLPPSIPFRWFGAAVVFHLAAWLVLLFSAEDWPAWRGGLGWPLAALHLVTLGTLMASAIGASLQLLPVATRQPVRWSRLPALLWWLYVPGVVALTSAMGLVSPLWLVVGGTAVATVLSIYALLLALNLRGARGMPVVVLHVSGGLAALVLLLASAVALVALWLGHPLLARDGARALHLDAGVFGFMGLMAFGLSYILLPMFALGRVPEDRRSLHAGWMALSAVGLAIVAAFVPEAAGPLRTTALLAGAIALVMHVALMRTIVAGGMRPDLGIGGRLIHAGWIGLALALAAGAVALTADPDSAWGRLFGLAAVGGWLMSFLFGVLHRILPFLASMHAARRRRRAPTPSALTHGSALAWHAVAHGLALVLLAAGIATSSVPLLRAAGAAGTVGALAFAIFFATLLRRLQDALSELPVVAASN